MVQGILYIMATKTEEDRRAEFPDLNAADYYQRIASTREGLRALAWNPGQINSCVFVVSTNGLECILYVNLDRDGFAGNSHEGHTKDDAGALKPHSILEMAESMRRNIDEEVRRGRDGNPRAIVLQPEAETMLRRATARLGLRPGYLPKSDLF
jgi:hypothetical protein